MELKGVFFAAVFSIFLVFISLASAINLEIEKEVINEVVIIEFDNPAIFEFTITNLNETDSFEFYSLVGVDITPGDPFIMAGGETKKVLVEITALESAKRNPGYYNFVYKIKGSNTGIQEDRLKIKIVSLKNAIELSADNINPDSAETTVHLINKEDFAFDKVEAEFSSVFFQFKKSFSLPALGKKSFTADLIKDEFKTLTAGPYMLDANIKIGNVSETIGSTIKFLEKSGLSTEESEEGFFVARHEITKKNEGNTQAVAEVSLEKNIISRLFTTFNIAPNKIERQGNRVLYLWQLELRPDESLTVIARTNWLFPVIIIIAIISIIFLAQIYLVSDLIVKKKIKFVKTKGGEFALKVSINLKARRFVEKINIIDKLPPIVKLYERYGTIAPDRIDEKNRRIEWNIESLNEGEESILSYIVYSKIGIIGKFELPSAKGVYEREGKIKETESNKVFFVSEPKKIEKKVEI